MNHSLLDCYLPQELSYVIALEKKRSVLRKHANCLTLVMNELVDLIPKAESDLEEIMVRLRRCSICSPKPGTWVWCSVWFTIDNEREKNF
jgi:hypothetical protein